MITAIIVSLIIMQLISFYCIILLNSKISKFKELEVRQDKLLREMDDTISVYLMDMQEENERFLQKLSEVKAQVTAPANVAAPVEKQAAKAPVQVNKQPSAVLTNAEPTSQQGLEEALLDRRPIVPKTAASRAYGKQVELHTAGQEPESKPKQKPKQTVAPKEEPVAVPTFEERVIALHKEGKSVADIAKQLQKGKTEIELLLKFHA